MYMLMIHVSVTLRNIWLLPNCTVLSILCLCLVHLSPLTCISHVIAIYSTAHFLIGNRTFHPRLCDSVVASIRCIFGLLVLFVATCFRCSVLTAACFLLTTMWPLTRRNYRGAMALLFGNLVFFRTSPTFSTKLGQSLNFSSSQDAQSIFCHVQHGQSRALRFVKLVGTRHGTFNSLKYLRYQPSHQWRRLNATGCRNHRSFVRGGYRLRPDVQL
mmetsp:Transcript_13823/g.22930  ORF Transcript_13823/g.22930 Transcript_13823/m.22930 type:complete len:215 (+) Transcript_13823:253-897(+)